MYSLANADAAKAVATGAARQADSGGVLVAVQLQRRVGFGWVAIAVAALERTLAQTGATLKISVACM